MDDELWRRASEDETATHERIEALRAQIAGEEQHLEEVRLFQAMLRSYSGEAPALLSAPASVPASAPFSPPMPGPGQEQEQEELSPAQAEELERLNRLFG